MFCPRCAAQNLDNAKFCRACGTNLEPVALALAGGVPATVDWIEQRKDAVSSIVRGISLLSLSLVVGVALGLFSNTNDWIIIWMVFAGWLAVWGVFATASGVTGLLNSKYARLQAEKQGLPASRATGELGSGVPLHTLSAQQSVTEQTTRSLSEVRTNKN